LWGGSSSLNRQHELKTIIDQVISEFDIKIEDPQNIYSLLQELKNSGLLTLEQFQKVEETVIKNSIILKYEDQPYFVLNEIGEIIYANDGFYQLVGTENEKELARLFNTIELIKLKRAVTIVNETKRKVKLSLKLISLVDKVNAKIIPVIQGQYYIILIK
jgi:PAS domain-containing protein